MNDIKKICVEVDSDLWKAIKLVSFKEGVSLKDAVAYAIKDWLTKKGEKV